MKKEVMDYINKKIEETKNEPVKKVTCPCGMNGKCCDKTDTRTPEHECSGEKICEECYGLECINCGKCCYHEL